MSQTDLQTPTKDVSSSIGVEVNEEYGKNNLCMKLTSPSQTISEAGVCTWADKVKSQITNPRSDTRETSVPKVPENGTTSKTKRLNKPIQRSNQLKSNRMQIAQPLKPRIKSNDNKVSADIDNESDGEWETVCRSKFSQRLKLIKQLHKTNSNQTFSDRPNRKSLLTKTNERNNAYLRRNKSKSENNLRLSTVKITSLTDTTGLSSTRPNVIKYHSSIVMSNESELLDSEVFGDHKHNPSLGGRPSFSSYNAIDTSPPINEKMKILIPSTGPLTELSNPPTRESHENTVFLSNSDIKVNAPDDNIIEPSIMKTNVKDSPITSVENSTDEFGDDDETTQNIRKLDQKLADVENAETQLQNELGRAQEEEKAYRQQIEQEEAALTIEEKTEISPTVDTTCYLEDFTKDDSDDGYDFVLNLELKKCHSPTNSHASETVSNKLLLPFEDIKNKTDISPLDWSQVMDDAGET